MTKTMTKVMMLGLAGGLVSAPALANKIMPEGKPVAVAKSTLTVTPSIDWNRMSARPGVAAESWTLDGLSLNDLTFYGGIADGQTLFRDAKKKTEPLPRFSKTMLIPDIAALFENSYRVALETSLMSVDSIEPAIFAGRPGFRFTYSYVVQDEEVRRKGEARGAVVDGRLYLITYQAPVIHYFNTDVDKFRSIADSARLTE